MSVGEWLNAAIAESAHDPDGDVTQPDHYQDTFERASPIADIHARLDAIGRQIDRISPRATPQHAPAREGGRALAHQLDEAISRIDRQLDQLSARASSPAPQAPQRPMNSPAQAPSRAPAPPAAESEFDRMVAAFGARRGELNGVPGRPAAPASQAHAHIPPMAQPQIDLAGLERQLQHITGRIEALHQPGPIDAAIASFREELAEIRRSLTEALPRKAVESIEHEIRALAHRIDNSRQCGADGAALANIERALGDILTIVRGLTPAEQLAGYDNAIRALSDKIDHIVRDSREPGAIDQLEGAIAALKDIASRVASHDVLDHLRRDIQHLAEKVGNMPRANDDSASLLGALEQRIAVLTEALESRPPQPAQDFSRVEGAMQALSARIEQLQPGDNPPETDPAAYLRLEARIGELLGRIDASSAQFSRFGDIERNLENILAEIERQREAIETGSRRAAGADMPDFGDVIRREMSDLRFSQSEAERRMQDSLETVHTTLGHVVDRLAQIEGDLRERRPSADFSAPAPSTMPAAAASAMPARPLATAPRNALDMPPVVPDAPALAPVTTDTPAPAPRPSLDNPARGMAGSEPAFAPAASSIASALSGDAAPGPQPAMRERAPAMAPQRPSPGARRPIDENLPPDFPIEPGTRPARPTESAAARIAASESVLDQAAARDSASDGVAATASPSSFIAAARRAARTAATQAGVRKTQDMPAAKAATQPLPANAMLDDDGARAKGTFSNRLRQILVGASVVVIVLAVLRVVLSMTGGEDEAKAPPPAAEKSSFVVPPTGSPSLPAPQPDTRATQKTASGLLDRPSLLAPPASEAINAPPAGYLGAPGAAGNATSESAPGDAGVTGSVAGKIAAIAPAEPEPDAKPAPRLPKFEGEVPAAIGNNALREAALAGDAAAAFEIATRYAEGKGVAVSYPDAAMWFERAAKAGIVPAMFRSGSLYEKGLGVKKDFAVARDYYVAAAERGNAKAMHNLAVLFADGGGKGPDYVNAAKWFRKAADYGLADSQYNLGILYARGIGVPQNLAESFKWFSLAAAQGDADAGRKRDDVTKRLDEQSMTAARLAVQTFAPESQPDEAINVAGMRAEWGETGGKQKARTNPRQTKAAAGPQRLPSPRPPAADQAGR